MSVEGMWQRVRAAWAALGGGTVREVRSGREREGPPALVGDEPALAHDGFAEEALPWMDAVYRFALRLVSGDRDAAEDLLQETFLRAHRFWHTFERGTNAKSWLFTICRNTHGHQLEKAHSRRERPASALNTTIERLATTGGDAGDGDPQRTFIDDTIDDEIVAAIDRLPEEFRETLVLSDLGDLTYGEVADVLGIPIGTVRSRLFRARRVLQDRLRDYAVREGYIEEGR